MAALVSKPKGGKGRYACDVPMYVWNSRLSWNSTSMVFFFCLAKPVLHERARSTQTDNQPDPTWRAYRLAASMRDDFISSWRTRRLTSLCIVMFPSLIQRRWDKVGRVLSRDDKISKKRKLVGKPKLKVYKVTGEAKPHVLFRQRRKLRGAKKKKMQSTSSETVPFFWQQQDNREFVRTWPATI